MSRRVILYTKPGCHLCEEVWADLQLLAVEHALVLEEIDITEDPLLFAQLRDLIPVVELGEARRLSAPITLRQLQEALA